MAFSVTMGLKAGVDPMDDAVYRHQYEASKRVDKSDDYKNTTIEVEVGPKNATGKRSRTPVVLKYALDGFYIFAVFKDNVPFHSLDREEWEHAAKNALEKFAATGGFQIKLGPRPEDGNRYNFMAELTKPVEMKPETIEVFQRARAEREARERYDAETADIRRRLGVQPGAR